MFAQYETYDPNLWTGSVYSTPAAASQPSGVLPILESILKVGGSVAGQYFQLQAVKEQSKALTEQATALAATRRAGMMLPSVYPTSTAGFAGMSTSTLLIIGLGGVAAVMMLKRRR